MNLGEAFYALHFDDDLIGDDKVGTMLGHVMALVVHGKAALTFERDAPSLQFDTKRRVIGDFRKPSFKYTMDLDGAVEDLVCDVSVSIKHDKKPPRFRGSWACATCEVMKVIEGR